MFLSTAVLCLAANVFYESRGEPIEGQFGVALVTMNRAHLDKSNVCEVVLKPKQFSWTINAVKNKRIKKSYAPNMKSKAWSDAMIVAAMTLNGMIPDITNGSDHYHAMYVDPKWNRGMKLTRVIGQHIFYKSNKSFVTNEGKTCNLLESYRISTFTNLVRSRPPMRMV